MKKPVVKGIFRRWWVMGLIGLALIGGGLAMWASGGKEQVTQRALYAAKEGPLTISVSSSGNIRSTDAQVINNKVEGRTTILWIIAEGSHVQEGDKLLELDSSALEDELVNEEIEVQTAQAELINAKENVELVKKQGQSDIDAAKVNLRLALLDLEKYTGMDMAEILGWSRKQYENTPMTNIAEQLATVDWPNIEVASSMNASEGESSENPMASLDQSNGTASDSEADIIPELESVTDDVADQGEFAQEMQSATSQINKLKMQLARAKDRYDGSQKLYNKGYITATEFESDRIEYNTTALDLRLAVSQKRLLQEFTKRRKLAELMSAVDQMAFALEKAVHQASSNLRNAQAELGAEQENYNREVTRMEETKEQLAACVVRAPAEGMVVYGTTGQDRWDDDPPLDEGVEVRERQELFRLPAAGTMTADIKIHESMLEKVTEGLPVVVTTDAMPDREFHGKISKVAVMPDSQSRFMNPDLKVYNTEVLIDGDTAGLRPGMSCQAEIIVKEFQNALYVPVQAVIRVEGQPSVFVVGQDGKAIKREVDVGLDNNRMIRIKSGLQAGEQVMLNPPLPQGAKSQGGRPGGPEEPSEEGGEQGGQQGEDQQPPQGERPEGEPSQQQRQPSGGNDGGFTDRGSQPGGRPGADRSDGTPNRSSGQQSRAGGATS